MTGYQLLDGALALLLTERSLAPEYADFAAALINMLLAETHEADNTIRLSRGLDERAAAGSIATLEDELPAEDELARAALMYGLAAKLIMDDGDMGRVAYFQNQYVAAVQDASKFVAGGVKDAYGGEGA